VILVQRWTALAAAALAIALGAAQASLRLGEQPPEPPAARALAVISRIPIPAGSAVALLLPAEVPHAADSPLLYEAAWQRPDLRWSVAGVAQTGGGAAFLVALGDAKPPAGWRATWRREIVTVYVRERT